MRRPAVFLGILVAACAAALATMRASEAHDVVVGDPAAPKFTKDIAPLLQRNCQLCHHEGGSAPMPLVTYEEAKQWSGQMIVQTRFGLMPPVSARRGAHEFLGPQRLTDAEIHVFEDWVLGGTQLGDPADLPPPLTFDDGAWKIGAPDAIVANAPHGYRTPPIGDDTEDGVADGREDIFQCFSVPTDFGADRWISAIEIHPGTEGATVHHVFLFLDVEGKSVALDRASKGPGYRNYTGVGFAAPVIGSWNAGAPPIEFGDGVGFFIPRRAHIAMQIHYSLAGDRKRAKTLIGFRFARSPVHRQRIVLQPKNENFTIPANTKGTQVEASMTLAEDMTVSTLTPHQHRLGYDIRIEAIYPGGVHDELIGVDWDVFHQGTYTLVEPVRLPAGTEVHVIGLYDNTADNPINPNVPPKDVSWGQQSFNEMLFGLLGVSRDGESLPQSAPHIDAARVVGSRVTVTGSGLAAGAFILVDGELARPTRITRNGATGRLPRGMGRGEMIVTVLNPDGCTSNAIVLTR